MTTYAIPVQAYTPAAKTLHYQFLLCANIGGALFHHFIRKDRVLQRMING
jgi:cytochrome b561